MDARDDRLEERLKGLGKALDREIGPVDTGTGWSEVQSRISRGPRRGRRRSRSGWWFGAAAALAVILIAAPYFLGQHVTEPNKPPATTTNKTGPAIPIGNVSAVDFLTGQQGFATVALGGYNSQNALLSTTNGGTSWTVRDLPQGLRAIALHFTDALHGYVLAQKFGTAPAAATPPLAILSTQNGGQTWTVVYSETGPQAIQNLTVTLRVGFQFFGAQGYAYVGDKILYTADGKTWTALTLPSGVAPAHMDFLSPTTGFVAGQACPTPPQPGSNVPGCTAVLLETTDGGQTWSTAFTAPQTPWSYSEAVSFASAQDGWFYVKDSLSWASYLYETTDGGKTWTLEQPVSSALSQRFLEGRTVPGPVTFATPAVGWLPTNAGAAPYTSGLLITRDGGKTWTTIGVNRAWSLNGVSIVSASEGYAAGESPGTQQGFLIKTTDGGKTWTQVLPSLSPSTLVDFTTSRVGFGIGTPSDPQTFLATTDGGKTWTERSRLPSNTVGISFVSATEGYAVQYPQGGGSAKIYRTTDGGGTWLLRTTLAASAGALFPYAPYVKFFDAQHGVLQTQSFPMLVFEATSDGGRTWHTLLSRQSVPGGSQQFSFVSPTTAYELTTSASQSGKAILQETTDGGKTWQTVQHLPSGDWGQAVYFASAEDGWVAVEQAPTSQDPKTVVMQTTDGGKTWTAHPIPGAALQPSGNGLLLQFPDAQHGWLMSPSSLYRTSDGGATWTQQP